MKITLPAVRIEEVGYRQNLGVDLIYFDAKRANACSPVRETPIRELKLSLAVVFDHDLKLARRAGGLGQIAVLAALGVVGVPILAAAQIASDLFESVRATVRGCGQAYLILRDETFAAARKVIG